MAVTEDQVRAALRQVLDPEIGKPIEDLGMLKGIEVEGDRVRVYVLLTIAGCPLRERIDSDVRRALGTLEGVDPLGAEVILGEMTDEQRQAMVTTLRGGAPAQGGDGHAGHDHGHGQGQPAGMPQQPTFFTDGKTTVITVASGKGGVGKSSVTVNLASALASEGHRVGVLDADVWGFSVPRMMGVSGQRPVAFNEMILPLESHGVRIISMGFFVDEETPVIWRGPMLHKAINQFLGDVYWGELDYLLIDLPPGTGDVSISLASFLPGAQMLVVTTPQEAARKVAERAGKMAERTHLRPIGVIENMSWFECPHCGDRTRIFGEGGGQEAADTLGVPLVGQVPLYPPLREGGDEGTPLVVSDPDSAAGRSLREAARRIAQESRSIVGKPLNLMVAPGAQPAGSAHQH
ncbi:MAG: Mrp/NBP35 family ATP-binding protein [Actinomycetota bacterium]|nr:Mrp/NBP35 family ATP-binding protein [Actinomycetota bacterium]